MLHHWNLIEPTRAAGGEDQKYHDSPEEHGNLHHGQHDVSGFF